jgi:hypothetical protein
MFNNVAAILKTWESLQTIKLYKKELYTKPVNEVYYFIKLQSYNCIEIYETNV